MISSILKIEHNDVFGTLENISPALHVQTYFICMSNKLKNLKYEKSKRRVKNYFILLKFLVSRLSLSAAFIFHFEKEALLIKQLVIHF